MIGWSGSLVVSEGISFSFYTIFAMFRLHLLIFFVLIFRPYGLIHHSDQVCYNIPSAFVVHSSLPLSINLKCELKCNITYVLLSIAIRRRLYGGISCLRTAATYNVSFTP